MGVSYKFFKILEDIYTDTKSTVWNGEELSEYFQTNSGVKQGCLLSPLLFSLYINDLHDSLGGGILIEDINIRLLMYADDIVILADDIGTLQEMIFNLEKYCDLWNLEVNLNKSEIVVFRNGGRLKSQEKWQFNGNDIKITNEYKYLGVILTPKMKFTKHVESRNTQAKTAISCTWKNFISNTQIKLRQKWNLFLAVCRSIQTYAAQVWGYGYFEEIDLLQRYFLKKVLMLPDFTPNYALMLETAAVNNHLYTLELHLLYMSRVMFEYPANRLPFKIAHILAEKNLFCFKELQKVADNLNIPWSSTQPNKQQWVTQSNEILHGIQQHQLNLWLQNKATTSRIYKDLDFERGFNYFIDNINQSKITWVFKARCGLIKLNYNTFGATTENKLCKLCNMGTMETFEHFLGVCPVLKEFRIVHFEKPNLLYTEMINILNGEKATDWEKLVDYLKSALQYRKFLIQEYN